MNTDSAVKTPVRVCRLSDLVAGEGLRIEVITPPVAVFLTEDNQVFAIDDTCTHQDASLAEGWVEGCEVECPLHASRFDLRTGQVDAPPAKIGVRAHTVNIEGDEVYLTLSSAEPRLPPGVSA